jgi:glycine cleavage system H protein
MLPQDLKYAKSHEYARIAGEEATIGITDYAAEQLGDVVFVELPEVGRELAKGETFGVVESVKAVSDLYAPLSGKVIAVNERLNDEASLINDDPFGEGWILKIAPSNPAEASEILDAKQYEELIGA